MRRNHSTPTLLPPALLLLGALSGCDSASRESTEAAAPPAAADSRRAEGSTAAGADSAALIDAAERIVSFLRGDAPFDPALFADTITLRVAPEGGGATERLGREALRDRSAWKAGEHAFVPAPGQSRLTTRFGRHFDCFEQDLATRYPELARMPHVGAKLQPAGAESCLQSWNLTLVFEDGNGAAPRLVAAVYDQWEW